MEPTLCVEALGCSSFSARGTEDRMAGSGGGCCAHHKTPRLPERFLWKGEPATSNIRSYFRFDIIKSSFKLPKIARYRSQMSARMVWVLRPGVHCRQDGGQEVSLNPCTQIPGPNLHPKVPAQVLSNSHSYLSN